MPQASRFGLWLIAVATLVQAVAVLQAPPLMSANDRSRWCAVWSLAERGTFQIDEIRQVPGWDTIDLLMVDGHYYSTKPPLLAVLTAGLYLPLKWMTGWTLLDETQLVSGVLLIVINVLPWMISVVVLDRTLRRLRLGLFARIATMTAATFGTLLLPFLATLNNHTPAAAAVTMTAYFATRLLTSKTALHASAMLAGLFAGLAVGFELPALAIMLPVFLAGWQVSRKHAVLVMVGFSLVMAGLVGLNIVATGELTPAYAKYGTEAYRFTIDGVPSYWLNPQGIDRNLDSPPAYIFHCLVGHHGWFSLTPMWLLPLVLLGSTLRRFSNPAMPLVQRYWVWTTFGLTLLVMAFYWTRTENYNYGGVSCALRWALWLTPLWLVALAIAAEQLRTRRRGKLLTTSLIAVSIVAAQWPGHLPWRHPWLFQRLEAAGWIDYRDRPVPFERPLATWIKEFPTIPGTWASWEVQNADGVRQVRLSIEKPQVLEGRTVHGLTIASTGLNGPATRTIWLDLSVAAAGSPPGQFVLWAEETSMAVKLDDLAFLRSIPLAKNFNPGFVRYLKTSLRPEAFACQRAAVEVVVDSSVAKEALPTAVRGRYRSDLWLSPEVPFGTLQMERTVSNEDGEVVGKERWRMKEYGLGDGE